MNNLNKTQNNITKPRVSVIVPTFNNGKFISQAIESILSQTFDSYEIIVVDDGSIDNTKQILDRYKERIRYLYQRNKGPSAARNLGILNSQGEFIVFLDADDVCMPERLAQQVACLDSRRDIDIVHSPCMSMDENSELLYSIVNNPYKEDSFLKDILIGKRGFIFSSIMMRRNCFDTIGLFDERLRAAEDLDIVLRLSLHGSRFFYIVEPLIKYRIRSGISSNPERVAKNMSIVLDKFFDNKNVPKDILFLKNKAYFHHLYYECCWYFYYRNDYRWKQYLMQAVKLYPEIMDKNEIFHQWFSNLIPLKSRCQSEVLENLDKLKGDISNFLQELYECQDLPRRLINSKGLIHENFNLTCGTLFYLARNMKKSRKYFLEAFKLNPRTLLNLSILFTFVKSLFGRAIIGRLGYIKKAYFL